METSMFDFTIPPRIPFRERRSTLILAVLAGVILDQLVQYLFWNRPARPLSCVGQNFIFLI